MIRPLIGDRANETCPSVIRKLLEDKIARLRSEKPQAVIVAAYFAPQGALALDFPDDNRLERYFAQQGIDMSDPTKILVDYQDQQALAN